MPNPEDSQLAAPRPGELARMARGIRARDAKALVRPERSNPPPPNRGNRPRPVREHFFCVKCSRIPEQVAHQCAASDNIGLVEVYISCHRDQITLNADWIQYAEMLDAGRPMPIFSPDNLTIQSMSNPQVPPIVIEGALSPEVKTIEVPMIIVGHEGNVIHDSRETPPGERAPVVAAGLFYVPALPLLEGKPISHYLAEQFPATVGHIPLEKWLEEARNKIKEAERALAIEKASNAVLDNALTSAQDSLSHSDLQNRKLEQCNHNLVDEVATLRRQLDESNRSGEALMQSINVRKVMKDTSAQDALDYANDKVDDMERMDHIESGKIDGKPINPIMQLLHDINAAAAEVGYRFLFSAFPYKLDGPRPNTIREAIDLAMKRKVSFEEVNQAITETLSDDRCEHKSIHRVENGCFCNGCGVEMEAAPRENDGPLWVPKAKVKIKNKSKLKTYLVNMTWEGDPVIGYSKVTIPGRDDLPVEVRVDCALSLLRSIPDQVREAMGLEKWRSGNSAPSKELQDAISSAIDIMAVVGDIARGSIGEGLSADLEARRAKLHEVSQKSL